MAWKRSAFLENWRKALQGAVRQTSCRSEGWQGPIAHQQFQKLGLLDVIAFRPDANFAGSENWRLGSRLRDFGVVVDTYQDGAKQLDFHRKQIAKKTGDLRSAETSILKLLTRPLPSDLKHSLKGTKELLKLEISKRTSEIEKLHSKHWNSELLLWRPALTELAPIPDRALGLNFNFQVRIGFLLLGYIHDAAPEAAQKMRFANASRLVLLFYWAAGLATKDSDSFNIRLPSGKLLTTKLIDQNLKRAGLDKYDFSLNRKAD